MKRLDVLIEMNGVQQYTGSIEVNDFGEGRFTYDSAYLQKEGAADHGPFSLLLRNGGGQQGIAQLYDIIYGTRPENSEMASITVEQASSLAFMQNSAK